MNNKSRLGILICAVLAGSSSAAAADQPTTAECGAAHEKAQEYRYQSKLLEARTELRTCAATSCPGLLRSDCSNWLVEVEEFMPSVVFETEVDGEVSTEVSITVDGRAYQPAPGESLELNPGSHEFVFEHPDFEPLRRRVVLRNGDKHQPIIAEFSTKQPEPTASFGGGVGMATPRDQEVPGSRPIPWTVWASAGVAVAGAASAGTFWFLANSKNNELSTRPGGCAPACSDDDVAPVNRNLLIADISAGVGIAGGIAAAVFYFTRPFVPDEDLAKQKPSIPVQVIAGPGQTGVAWGGQF